MSSDKANVCDEHKYPFSLVSEFKHGHNRDVTKVGDVTELMDKAIGRLVFRVKGSVSATNYVEFDSLNLYGPILYIQMCLAKPSIATIHLEIKTTTNIPLRLTLSTLYNGDQPRFLGRSLRLPLPAAPGWMVLAVDLNQILSSYCLSGPKGPELQLKAIQKIQLCSNMLLRDIVTSDKEIPLETKYLPKELAVKPLPASQGLQFVDLVEYCASLGPSTGSSNTLSGGDGSAQSSPDVDTKVRAVVAQKMAALGLANNTTSAGAGTASKSDNQKTNPSKTKSIRNSDSTTEAYKLNHALLHQAFPPPPPTPGNAAAGPVLPQPEVQTPLASVPPPPRAGSTRRSTGNTGATNTLNTNNTGTLSSTKNKQIKHTGPEPVGVAKSPVRPPVALKQMNLSTVTTTTTTTTASSTTAVPNNDTASVQLTQMFEEVNHTLQEKTNIVQTSQEGNVVTSGPVSANATSRYAPTAAATRHSSATRIRTSRSAATSVVHNNTANTTGNSHSGTGSSVLHNTVLSKALSTPRHIPLMQIPTDAVGMDSFASPGGQTTPQNHPHYQHHNPNHHPSSTTGSSGIVKYSIPETLPGDRVLQLERLLGYSGGPAVLLYEGRMLLLATGSLLVMVDLDKEGRPVPTNGLFRAFKSVTSLGTSIAGSDRELGFKQSFLRGHANPIGLIEVSEKELLMATGETSTVNGALILWDAREGRRLATLHPHTGLLQLASFSTDGSLLVTVGTDLQFRQQIIVWDIAQLIAEKTVNILHLGGTSSSAASTTSSGVAGGAGNIMSGSKSSALVAKQISEFPVLKIRFSPFEEFGLVSCGRENIRFWRIRKGHLPGRPVLLNEYARGFTFQDIAFHSDAGATPRDPRRPAAYFASNKGLVLRVDCTTDQILCAYQLHPNSIRTLCIHSGYAVTGAEDNKLRLWPLDFTDFLLEAQHEGCVTQIHVALDGRKLCIGTDAGTLGVLNVSEHSYSTVLRSHCGSVTQVMPCLTGAKKGLEFATVGKDNTVRIWDAISGNQVIEFTSEKDRPTCSAYHPASDRYIACGYQSGHLRVFDVTTATAALEVRVHSAAVVAARYIHRSDTHPTGPVSGMGAAGLSSGDEMCTLLATASLDGTVCIHDASEGGAYLPIKRISFGGPVDSILLQVSDDSLYLAVGAGLVGSLTVFETKEFVAILRLSGAASGGGSGSGGSSPVPSGADFPTATVQSTTYLTATAVSASTAAVTIETTSTEDVAMSPDAAVTPAAQSATATATNAAPTATAEYLMSPTHRATASSAANTSTAHAANVNHNGAGLYAPLVGACFAKDRMGGALLIVTDKHIISVGLGGSAALSLQASPMHANASAATAMSASSVSPSAFFSSPSPPSHAHSEYTSTPAAASTTLGSIAVLPSKRAVHAWEERLSKRLDCGVPVSATRDSSTGLLFLAIRPPVPAMISKTSSFSGVHSASAGDMGATFRSVAGGTGTLSALSAASGGRSGAKSGNNKISDVANAFAVIDVRHRTAFTNATAGVNANAKKERLGVSVPQLYLDLPGPVEGICPCAEAGKVATVDANGTISLWHLRAANIAKVKVDITAPSPSDALLQSAQQSREYRSSGTSVARNLASPVSRSGVNNSNGSFVSTSHATITEAIIEEEPKEESSMVSPAANRNTVRSADSAHCETVDTAVNTPSTTADAGVAPCTPGTAAAALTRDFERAVLHDPSMWSAASSSSATSLTSPAAQAQALAQLDASQQVRAELYEHNIGSPDAKKSDSFPLRQTVNNDASTKSQTNKTRMSTKASAEKQNISNATTAAPSAYDQMFQEEQTHEETSRSTIFAAEEEDKDKAPAVMDLSALRSADTSLMSTASHAHRAVATHSVTTTAVTALTTALTSEPIDNPLAGLNVWLEMQSPVGKSLRPEHHSPKRTTHPGQNTDEAEDSDGEESSQVSRHLDSLDLLQRARTNMNASRLGDSLAAAQSGAAGNTSSSASGVPLTYFTQPLEATQQSNLIAVNYANAVAPNFCQSKSMLLTSDGASVVVKYINTGDQLVLGFPAPLTYCRAKSIITEVKLHESGNMIAALVRTSPKSVYYLVTWVMVGAGEVEDGTFVPSAAEWRCMGFADLGVVQPAAPVVSVPSGLKVMAGAAAAGPTAHDHHQGSVCLEWTPTGSLLVLTSQDSAAADSAQLGANGLLKFTLVPPEVIYAGTLNVNWDDVHQVVQSPLGRVLGVKALPGVVVEEPFRDIHAQVPTVHVVVYGESRALMAALTVTKATPGRHGGWAREVAQVVWSDDLGARGPILAVDATVCPPHCISSLHSSTATSSTTSSAPVRRHKASHSSGVKAESVLRSGGRGMGREATDSLVAVLDSCGSVKFSLFSFYQEVGQEGALDRLPAPFVRSVTTKVPAANASGALRTLSLFSPQTRRAPHFLALAGTHDVRLCTLALRELNSKSVAVSLTVLYKVSLQSPPDYLLSIQPVAYGSSAELSRKLLTQMGPVGQAPHLFVSNHQGYSGFVPNVRWLSGRHLPSSCLTLQSSPLHCPAGSTVTSLTRPCTNNSNSKRGELLAALVKGQVHLYHGGSGIKLPFAGCKGIAHGTTLLPLQHHNHQLFAVGSRCGRVVLFDADLLQQQELVALPTVSGGGADKGGDHAGKVTASKDATKTSANALFKKAAAAAPRERSSKAHTYSAGAGAAVTSLRSAARGRLLLAAQESGAVSVIEVGCANRAGKDGMILASIFAPSVVSALPAALYQDHSALQHLQVSQERLQNPFQHTTVLATVAGEARLSGVIRQHSNVLELYFQDDHVPVGHTGHAPVQLHNFLNVSLKTPQDLDLHDEKESSAYFAASQSKHAAESGGVDIDISACHIIVTERTYVISIVGRQVPSHSQHNVTAEQAAASPVYLYSGSVTLPDVPSVTASTVRSIVCTAAHNRTAPALDVTPYLATLRQRVLLDELPALTCSIAAGALAQSGEASGRAKAQHWEVQNSISFCSRHCAVVTAEVVYVVDLLKVYTSAPGSEVSTLCTSMVASQITSLGATSFATTSSHSSSTWADSAALLCTEEVQLTQPSPLSTEGNNAAGREGEGVNRSNEEGVDEEQSLRASSLSLVVYRRHKPAMFTFHIKCE